jgi:mRNA interferase MazF
MALVARRFDVFLVREMRKTRPCVVISPEEMNQHIRTVIVAPMTTKGQPYPSRVPCTFQGKKGHLVLDQIRTIDQVRLARRMGRLTPAQSKAVLAVLQAMFAE